MDRNLRKKIILLSISFIAISLAFSYLVIRDFSHPLAGNINDDNVWEYMGFYIAKNLSFSPFPQINFSNNQVFYPYGINSVLQPWGIEQSGFYAIFYLLFGIGPWLQIYYLLSVLITALGTSFLLIRDYGLVRASVAGLTISFFNYYAIHKYPSHFSLAVIHWMVFSFLADFLIAKRIVLRQYVSLRLILVRLCLLMLSLGQDLGYITGFALLSFTVSNGFIAVLIGYRYTQKEFAIAKSFKTLIHSYLTEFSTYFRSCLALIGLSVIATYLYLPLAFQIAKEAKSLDFSQIFFGAWWANPLRLLIPFLPGINPVQMNIDRRLLGDLTETPFDGMVGWSFLILGTVGLWQSRKQITPYIPLILIFLICLFYHPVLFPTLKIFPWFSFNRAGGRCTIIYPIIFTLFSLNVNFNSLRLPYRNLLSGLLVCLACAEVYTAYSFKFSYQPYAFDKNFFAYMNYVKQQPGEAVLDWPFCAGTAGIFCPYWNLNGGIYAQRRFHEKKVMGQYFARVHPSQIQPYLQAGWDKMFSPNNPDVIKATRETRCFNENQWSFFSEFFKFNDFAGINLYVDLLPEECVKEFYQRFGNPVMETKSPGVGRVQFIPKSPKLRSQVNPALGASLKFGSSFDAEPNLNFSESDLLKFQLPEGSIVEGLGKLETDAKGYWRWSMGSQTFIKFKLSEYLPLEVSFKFINSMANQNVVVKANGVPLQKILGLEKGEIINSSLKFKGIPGWNYVIFSYLDGNNNQISVSSEDRSRPAVKFTQLVISHWSLVVSNWNKLIPHSQFSIPNSQFPVPPKIKNAQT